MKDLTLSKEEKKCQDFIDIAFSCHEGEWEKTSNRLLDAFKGKYYKKYSNRDRFTVNTIFSLVNLLLPNFIIQQPYIVVKPQNSKYYRKTAIGEIEQINNIDATRIRSAAINHDYRRIDAIGEDRKALQDSFFYGFGITKTGYSFETLTTRDQDYVLKDSPFHKRVCPKDFGWHPLATNVDDSVKLVHRIVTTREKLKETDGLFKKSLVDSIQSELPRHVKEKLSTSKQKSFDEFITLYEVFDQEKNMYYYYGGESHTFLGKKKRAYLFSGSDYSMIKFAGDVDDFLGIPILSTVEDECIALNEVMTLIVEHMRKFPGQVFLKSGSFDDDVIEAIRNGEQGSLHILPEVGEDAIRFKNPLQMGSEYFSIVSLLQNIIDKIIGVPDFQRLSGSNRKSATEASYIQGDATVRRTYYLSQVKDFVLDGVKKVAALQAQYQDRTEEVMVTGDMGVYHVEYNKNDLQGDYQFTFDVDNMAYVNQAESTNLINMLNVVSSQPALQPIISTFDPMKLGKELFKRVNLDIESFQTEEPENMVFVPPERENMLARSGKPMPQPKHGEPHKHHIKIHLKDLQKNGSDEQIIDHIAATQILMQNEAESRKMQQPQQVATPTGNPQADALAEIAAEVSPGVNENTPNT